MTIHETPIRHKSDNIEKIFKICIKVSYFYQLPQFQMNLKSFTLKNKNKFSSERKPIFLL